MQEWFQKVGLADITLLSICVRLLLSVICSAALGIERTRKLRPAGLRTYMLVCLGATVVMMTGIYITQTIGGSDPARLAAQVISGIGFIGAGTIMVTRYYRVKGLTTAAGLWVAACMGLAIGAGFYVGAILVCVLLLFIMIYADRFETYYTARLRRMHVYLVLDDILTLRPLITYIKEKGIGIADLETMGADSNRGVGMFCTLKLPPKLTHEEALLYVENADGVLFMEEIES